MVNMHLVVSWLYFALASIFLRGVHIQLRWPPCCESAVWYYLTLFDDVLVLIKNIDTREKKENVSIFDHQMTKKT